MFDDYKTNIIIFLLITSIAIASGCASNYQTFDKEGILLQYPGNWTENFIPTNDQSLANKSGFNIIGVFLEGGTIKNYTTYMGIAIGNVKDGNLKEAADRLYNNFIIEEANYPPIVNRTNLKNGYESYVYTYNGTGASSGQTIYEQTYIFSKDNKTVYYIMFATLRTSSEDKNKIIQEIMDSIIIK